jgi:hypothetical protein
VLIDRQGSSEGSSRQAREWETRERTYSKVPKLRTDSTFVCRDSAKSAEVEKPFKVSERTKLRRKSAFVHRAIAARSAEVEKL